MKKTILPLCLCLCVAFAARAQETEKKENPAVVNKRGIALLPKAGDYAIGVSADPFLHYLGNFFNQSGINAAPSFGNYTLYGKYFLADNRAIRAEIRLNFRENTNKHYVRDDHEVTTNPLNPDATVADVQKISNNDVYLSAGYEFRRGRGRIQGFYGAGLFLSFNKTNSKYEYGNPMTEANQNPTNAFGFGASRVLETKGGLGFGAGIGAFVGVEYFVAPQLSLGGELGLDIGGYVQGIGKSRTEFFNPVSGQAETKNASRNGQSSHNSFALTTVPQANISLMFHF